MGRGVADRFAHHRRRGRLAGSGTPVGTALLDDVTLSNAGLREDAGVVVAPVTVYGARSVTVTGSKLATGSVSSATLRQALLGKVMTVGDTVSLLPRDLGPGTSTSAASSALATAVGITWTSELLTVGDVDPAGPVSVQPNSVVAWADGITRAAATSSARHQPAQEPEHPTVSFDDLKGSHVQAGKLIEWLKLALDEPQLLETLGATANLGVLVSGPAGVGKSTLVRAVCESRHLVELDGPEIGALAAEDTTARRSPTAASTRVRDRRRGAADHRHRRAAARIAGPAAGTRGDA